MLTNQQKTTVAKYVKRYPHLATLAKNAELEISAAKALGDQIGRLAAPSDVSGAELQAVCDLGLKNE